MSIDDGSESNDQIDSIKKALERISPYSYHADSKGKVEGENFDKLETETKEYTEHLASLSKDIELAKLESEKLSQTARKHLLYCLRWPIVIGICLLMFIGVLGATALTIISSKVWLEVITKDAPSLLALLLHMSKNGLTLTFLLAPVGAVIIAIAAWLFKSNDNKDKIK